MMILLLVINKWFSVNFATHYALKLSLWASMWYKKLDNVQMFEVTFLKNSSLRLFCLQFQTVTRGF